MMTNRPRRGKVLVVDDDRVALEVARERLVSAGFAVVTRNEALGTSAAIQKEQPDFVLLDVMMPGLSGDSLARLILERDRRVAIILHSASDDRALRDLAHKCGAIGVIVKTGNDQAFLAQFDQCVTADKRSKHE